jgi:hypothetical protein
VFRSRPVLLSVTICPGSLRPRPLSVQVGGRKYDESQGNKGSPLALLLLLDSRSSRKGGSCKDMSVRTASSVVMGSVLALGVLFPLASWAQPPSVTSASPATVRLVVGGAPVTVTLGGSGLDHAGSVRVLLTDTPVPPVTAELGPAASPTRRTVVLRAGPDAPVGNYVVQLRFGARSVAVPLTLTVARTR